MSIASGVIGIVTSSWSFKKLVVDLGEAFDMSQNGMLGRPIGWDLADIIATSIILQSNRQIDPDGRLWRKLTKAHLAWKAKKGYDHRINFMTGRMLDLINVRGTVIVSKDGMEMRYGVSGFEQLKAEWTSEGTSHNKRPARPFYAISKYGLTVVDRYLDKHLDLYIVSLGARRI